MVRGLENRTDVGFVGVVEDEKILPDVGMGCSESYDVKRFNCFGS